MKIGFINSLLVIVGLYVWLSPRTVDYVKFMGFSEPLFISEEEDSRAKDKKRKFTKKNTF